MKFFYRVDHVPALSKKNCDTNVDARCLQCCWFTCFLAFLFADDFDSGIRAVDRIRRCRQQSGVFRRGAKRRHEDSAKYLHHQPGHLRPDALPVYAAVQLAEGVDAGLEPGPLHVQAGADVLRRQRVRVHYQHHGHRPRPLPGEQIHL